MTAAPQRELSVIVASRNRREQLRRCLEALGRQTQDPRTFEVIVADDGSTDGTAAIGEGLDTPFALRVLRLDQAGKASAQNAAIRASEARVCLFMDDDVVASPELVAEHLAAHEGGAPVLGIGRLIQEPPPTRDPYASAAAQEWNERYDELAGQEPDWTDCYGGNFSAPRAALVEVGGFETDPAVTEDLEIGFRLCRAGCVPHYLPGARAVHHDHKPGRMILARRERFGVWCAEFIEAHPETRRRLVGWFSETTLREILLRCTLLATRVPPTWLAALGRLVPGRGRQRIWFGFVSRYAFWRAVRRSMSRADWLQTTRGVPVLMYHAFGNGDERDRFILPKRSFSRQMRALTVLRYRAIELEDLARALREGRPLPRRVVVITIDDGYRDNLEIAHPILRRHRFPATVFLVSGRLGGRNDWDEKGAVAGRPLLSPAQVKQMRTEGISFGAHTRSHCSLPDVAGDAAIDEITGSREDLEQVLGEPVTTFAYPYGHFDQRTVEAAGQAGFAGACTAEGGFARFGNDPLSIPRIEVRGNDSAARFLRNLWLGRS